VKLLRRPGLLPLLVLGLMTQTGCITRWLGMGGEPQVEGSKGSITITKLERLIDSFADRDVALIADACEAVKRETPDAAVRRGMQHVKLANGSAVYDIITQPQPLGRLADLYVLVELQHLVWVEEGGAQRRFGNLGYERLVPAIEELRRDMARLADLAMKPDRRQKFDHLIRRWRDRNPNVQFVSGIRFGSLPEAGSKSIFASASSFFDVINPLDDTSDSVERSRLLADRAFHFSKRLPKLLDWQAEAALDDTIAKPEVRAVLDAVDRVSKAIEQMPDRVAREREEILKSLDDRHADVVSGVREVRELAVRATEAGNAFERAFRELHAVVGKDPENPPSRPFDIRDYTEAAVQYQQLAREGESLVEQSKSLIDYVVWRVIAIMLLLFTLLVGYRLLLRRRPVPDRATRLHRPPTTLGWPT
jgi:hypothetical protein